MFQIMTEMNGLKCQEAMWWEVAVTQTGVLAEHKCASRTTMLGPPNASNRSIRALKRTVQLHWQHSVWKPEPSTQLTQGKDSE